MLDVKEPKTKIAKGKFLLGEILRPRLLMATDPDFIERVVRPAVYDHYVSAGSPSNCTASVCRDRGLGRATVQYDFEDGITVFGKIFTDGLGAHSHDVMEGLWADGFRTGQPYLVPHMLAYLPEHNYYLASGAEGTPLSDFIGKDHGQILDYVRDTARWLVKLHRSPMRCGASPSIAESSQLGKILRRLAKATTSVPQERKKLLRMVKFFCDQSLRDARVGPVVQTHGTFNHHHAYVNGETVTLIDFDRSLPSDPATDLAEFIFDLRLQSYQTTGNTDLSDALTRTFLNEYLSELPENARNFRLYWGAYIIVHMFKYSKKHGKRVIKGLADDAAFEQEMDFLEGELEMAFTHDWMPEEQGWKN